MCKIFFNIPFSIPSLGYVPVFPQNWIFNYRYLCVTFICLEFRIKHFMRLFFFNTDCNMGYLHNFRTFKIYKGQYYQFSAFFLFKNFLLFLNYNTVFGYYYAKYYETEVLIHKIMHKKITWNHLNNLISAKNIKIIYKTNKYIYSNRHISTLIRSNS